MCGRSPADIHVGQRSNRLTFHTSPHVCASMLHAGRASLRRPTVIPHGGPRTMTGRSGPRAGRTLRGRGLSLGACSGCGSMQTACAHRHEMGQNGALQFGHNGWFAVRIVTRHTRTPIIPTPVVPSDRSLFALAIRLRQPASPPETVDAVGPGGHVHSPVQRGLHSDQ